MFKRLRSDINCVFERDPAARNTFEVLTTYPGLHAIIWYRIAHWFWLKNLKWIARFISTLARWLTGVEIHPACRIGDRLFIDHGMGVVIGETAEIGDDCTLYHGVTLGGTTWQKGKRHPTLGDRVVVGAGAKILGPIYVGDDARVGSNAVVIKEVPEGRTVVGIPGRVVEQKEPEERKRRAKMAEKIGFDAYGVKEGLDDPIERTIYNLLGHIQAQDEKLEALAEEVRRIGGAEIDVQLPKLDDVVLESEGSSQSTSSKGQNKG